MDHHLFKLVFLFVLQIHYSAADFAECGGPHNVTDPFGTITSTNFGDPSWPFYDPNSSCVWNIFAPLGYLIEIKFSFVDFGKTCRQDYIYLYNSKAAVGAVAAEVCGQIIPPPFLSDYNYATILFSSDFSDEALGFKATYRRIVKAPASCLQSCSTEHVFCGGPHNVTDPFGTITSTNFGDPSWPFYDPESRCTWNIYAPVGYARAWSLILYSMVGAIAQKICGQTIPSPPFVSEHNYASMIFVSYTSGPQALGFKATYRRIPKTPVLGLHRCSSTEYEYCGGPHNVTDPFGTITSTNFGDPSWPFYDPESRCTWNIYAPVGYVIEIKFSFVDFGETCGEDSILILNNYEPVGVIVQTICGQTIPSPPFVSEHNYASMIFISYTTGPQALGFKATYRRIPKTPVLGLHRCSSTEYEYCGGPYNLTEPFGTITSTNYGDPSWPFYNPNSRCVWNIIAPIGYLVEVKFSFVDFGKTCGQDYIYIINNYKPVGGPAQKICGQTIPSPPFVSDYNYASILFLSDSNQNQALGFKATYRHVIVKARALGLQNVYSSTPSGCGGPQHLTDSFGTVSTMNFADPSWPFYDADSMCTWLIEAPIDYFIEVEFQFLEVGDSKTGKCGYDAVYIFDSKEPMGAPKEFICGKTLPSSPFLSTGNHVFIGFVSDDSGHELGFQATYRFIIKPDPTPPATASSGCGDLKYRTDNHGTITSMDFDGSTHYKPDAECTWIITTDPEKLVTLKFIHFDLEDNDCTRDVIFVYDGSIEEESPPIIELRRKEEGSENEEERKGEGERRHGEGRKKEKKYFPTIGITCPQGSFKCLDDSCIDGIKLCDGKFDCKDESDESGCPGNRLGCGKPVVTKGLIVGGTAAEPGAWPWQSETISLFLQVT
ncbi:cubilin-like [Antedon mediterranea]|uniref:cubilin-like n=1 Tax=Antedon mediterranea TaxID=105859 RepID=UPI003AF8B0F9